MTSRVRTARVAGLLYLVMGLAGAFSIAFIPTFFMIRGDAAATAAKIVAWPLLYRVGIVCDLANQVGFILLVMVLYDLLKDVNRRHARLMVALVLVQVAATFANMLTQIAPLVLLSGADYLKVFEKKQLDAFVLGILTLRGRAIVALGAYMGLWLLPFGALVYRSGYIPRALGVILLVAGAAYVLSTVTFFLLLEYFRVTNVFMTMAAGVGECAIVGWLLIKGARNEPSASDTRVAEVPSR